MYRKIMYALAGAGPNILAQTVNIFLIFYFVGIGVPESTMGIVFTLFSVYNAANNLVIGTFLDQLQGRKFTRFLLLSIPLMTVPFMALFTMATFLSNTNMIILVASVLLIIYEAGISFFSISHQALLEAIWPRSQWAEIILLQTPLFFIATGVGTIVPPTMKWSHFTIGASIFVILTTLITGIFLHSEEQESKQVPLRLQSIIDLWQKKRFAKFYSAEAARLIIASSLNIGLPFFVTRTLGLEQNAVSIVYGISFLLSILSALIWRQIIDQDALDKVIKWPYVVVLIGIVFLVFSKNLPITVIGASFIGIGTTGSMMINQAMTALLVRLERKKDNTTRSGLIYGMGGFITSISGAGTGVAFTVILGVGLGYHAFIILAPLLATIISLVFLWNYQLFSTPSGISL